jgi:diguanylate cyclase (GGDEF)-like protein
VAYLDVDNFKQLNDRLGHTTGDAVLVDIVQTIRRNIRISDYLGRLGGDEFGLLLPEQESEGVLPALSRVQRLVAEHMSRMNWPVTLSVGAVTFLRPSGHVDVMIQQADALLMAAKSKGKGRLEHVVVPSGQSGQPERHLREKRASVRRICNRPARAHWENAQGKQEERVIVQDISAEGARLYLPIQLPRETLVQVQPLVAGTGPLWANVLYALPVEGGWKHGCKLANRLKAEELAAWLPAESARHAELQQTKLIALTTAKPLGASGSRTQ